MRIALIVPGGFDPSEEFRVIPALLALLKRLTVQHEVHVFALAQIRSKGTWTLYGATIHNLADPTSSGRIANAVSRIGAVAAILRANRVRPFDAIQAIWSGSCGLVATVAAKLLAIPFSVHVAGGELAAVPDIGYGGYQNLRGRLRERLVLRSANAVSAASTPIIRQIATLGVAARIIPLGVDLSLWPQRLPVRREPNQPARLIHVASLNRVKDQPLLLNALAELAAGRVEFCVDIVGEDTLAGEIQALAQRLDIAGRICFHGFLTQRQLRPIVERADVNIVSSRHEAGPLVVLEAAVVGVPTVGTAVGHIAEMAPSAAVSVPVGSASALAAGIKGLIDNEEWRLAMAHAAMKWGIARDADFTAAQFEALFTKSRQG
jgi:glycosyltransferase involved in cell wall biosynthesis